MARIGTWRGEVRRHSEEVGEKLLLLSVTAISTAIVGLVPSLYGADTPDQFPG